MWPVPSARFWKAGWLAALLMASPATAQSADAPLSSPAPDYSDPQSWAAWPGRPGAADTVPTGASLRKNQLAADVFYIHPTTFRHASEWNQNLQDDETNRWTDASVIARQASIFNRCCRVFAPRYRQASSRAVGALDGEGGKAFALAYSDIERAFDAFLDANAGRPFILAGHSQGGAHVVTLLQRRIDGTPLADRMIAAYAIGFNLSEGDFGKTFGSLRPCDRPSSVGCVVGWNAVTPELDRQKIGALMEQRYVRLYGDEEGKRLLCVNPLTFDRRKPRASIRASKGAIPGEPGAGPVEAIRSHLVSAECRDGLLVVTADPVLGLQPLPGGSLHFHDLGLFFGNVRADADRRIARWFAHSPRPALR